MWPSAAPDSAAISKDAQLSDATTTQVVEERTAEFSHQAPVLIRDSIGDVLGGTANDGGAVAGGMVRDGQIYLFRDGRANTADVAKTLWYELVHCGLRRLLTKEQYVGGMCDLFAQSELNIFSCRNNYC